MTLREQLIEDKRLAVLQAETTLNRQMMVLDAIDKGVYVHWIGKDLRDSDERAIYGYLTNYLHDIKIEGEK